jgi:hypothetical protein
MTIAKMSGLPEAMAGEILSFELGYTAMYFKFRKNRSLLLLFLNQMQKLEKEI